MHHLVSTCCSCQLLSRATPDTTKTNRMPVSPSRYWTRFDTLKLCDRRFTKFTEESFVLTIVTKLPPTGTILSRSQLLKEKIATRFKDYLSTSLQFIYLLIVSVPVILWINKPTSLLMNHHYPDTTYTLPAFSSLTPRTDREYDIPINTRHWLLWSPERS